MARENQGLQIALIIFVMLTLVLGVTTFIFFRRADENSNTAKSFQDQLGTTTSELGDRKADIDRLKAKMGFSSKDEMQGIDTQFDTDMKTYAGALPEEKRKYRDVVIELARVINERNDALARAQADVQDVKNKLAVREGGKDQQIKEFRDQSEKAGTELQKEHKTFEDDRKRITGEQTQLAAQLAKARKDSQEALAKVDGKMQEVQQRMQKLTQLNEQKTEIINNITKEVVDVPDGAIRWVDQRSGMVWINLGRADALSRQMSFSVYGADASDLTKSGKKASVQVTQILGDHLAEAKIIDDTVSNPIVPGDKIFTPVWNPGEKKHFAVTGFVDLDGDGKSDIQALLNIIASNGGVVDCWSDDKGEKHGEMTTATRYLILGAEPSTKGAKAMIDVWTKMIDSAKQLGVDKMPLNDMLARMGWKNETPVVRYGRGANPKDFAPKPENGVPGSTAGNVSQPSFAPRTPPRSGHGSAY